MVYVRKSNTKEVSIRGIEEQQKKMPHRKQTAQ